jgi:phage-related holin
MSIRELWDITKHYIVKIFGEDPFAKSMTSILVILFGSDRLLAIFIVFLVIIDFITGIVKAKHLNEKIESNKFRRTVLKLYIYYSLVITLGIVDYMVGSTLFLRVGYAFIGITEGKSILENLIAVYPNLSEIKVKLKWWKDNGSS